MSACVPRWRSSGGGARIEPVAIENSCMDGGLL